MSLLKQWQKKHLQPAATAIVATVATKAEINPPTVAVVAEIAVADAQKQINEQADLTSAHMARTEQESALYDARLLSFKGKGMSNDAANAIAKRLIERDNDQRMTAEAVPSVRASMQTAANVIYHLLAAFQYIHCTDARDLQNE